MTAPTPSPPPGGRRRRLRLGRRAVLLMVSPLALGALVLQALLHGGSGGIPALVAGLLPAAPLEHRDAPLVPPRGAEPFAAAIELDRAAAPLARLAPEYLSVGLDAAQLVGGPWWEPEARALEFGSGSTPTPAFDFERPGLDALVAPLAPAWLRVGGSESDALLYAPERDAPEDGRTLDGPRWEELERFAERNGLRVLFTLSAGPAMRRADGSWDPGPATALVRHALQGGTPVEAWELGNELNGFWAVHGPRHHVAPAQYARDLAAARAMLAREQPDARLVTQGAAFWPLIGEPLSLLFAFTEPMLEHAGGALDAVGWHYYPQQSRRVPVASRRAGASRLLRPEALDECAHWSRHVAALRDEHAPGREVWLTETGNAQFGGEPGVSDVYVGTLWWLDQLGLLARSGTDIVVRHTLCGMDYGLLDADTLAPRPDYWASLLWKRLMGPQVLAPEVRDEGSGRLRAYAHRDDAGAVTLLVINHDPARPCDLDLGSDGAAALYELSTADVLSRELRLNGVPLELERGSPPPLPGRPIDAAAPLRLNPLCAAFIVLPPAGGSE